MCDIGERLHAQYDELTKPQPPEFYTARTRKVIEEARRLVHEHDKRCPDCRRGRG